MTAPDALHFAACIERARQSGFPAYAQAMTDLALSFAVPLDGNTGLTTLANDTKQAADKSHE